MKQWHLIQLKPNAHRLAEKNLRRQGFETFLPMHQVTRRSGSKFVSELRPLFPGYMFVGAGQAAAPWRKINSTVGVSRLVSFGTSHRPLPSELIDALMARCDESGEVHPAPALEPGDSVEVLGGPFMDFVATVEAIDEGQRVWVLMDLMGQAARVQVDPLNVRRAE